MERLRRWLVWIRDHRKDWPVLVSILVGFFNTEFVIPVVFRGIFDLSGRKLALAAGTWATTELCWWIFFSGWLFLKKIRNIPTVSEAINVGHEVVDRFDLKELLKPRPGDIYLVAQIKRFAIKHSIDNFDLDNYQDNPVFLSLVNFLKGIGYFLACLFIFVIGFLPFFWIFGLMACRWLKWRWAYLPLFTSNFLKNYFMALVYDRIGFWPWLISFVIFLSFLAYIIKRMIKKLKLQSTK